jgi:hydrogenase maturation factor
VRPGVGEDTAAVRAPDEGVLVLKSDPITFATDRIGYYSVLVNANDIATSGAVPRWLLVTLLLPEGSKAGKVWEIMRDLHDLCAKLGIALCGGHTEITDGVTRPIVSATLIGTVKRKSLVRKADIATGDAVILTKGVSVEGTSILCREFGFRLIELGMSGKMVKRGAEFLSRISVLQEAKAAVESGWVTGMHDVTEGGLATAITELSEATRKRFLIDIVRIPFYPETVTACDLLGIDPLGLIGSGSLIICCVGDKADALRALLGGAGHRSRGHWRGRGRRNRGGRDP